MALCTALAVASNYYCQPLIGTIMRDLPGAATAFVPTATQLGYALGLFVLVPLGDMVERRRLVVGQFLALAAGLAMIALAPTGAVLLGASLFVGLASTAAQQIVPFAANLVAPERRGAVIGMIASAAMAGVLLSRTFAGLVGGAHGWRTMYWSSVPLVLLAALLMGLTLPRNRPQHVLGYGPLMASLATLWRRHGELRVAAITEALIFGAYMTFWTTMALRLHEPDIGLGPEAAGAFGLVGIVGVVVTPLIGRFADRRGAYPAIIGGTLVCASGWALMGLWNGLAGLVVGIALIDPASRSVLISCQLRVFVQDPDARSRLNTIYVGTMFTGGAICSALAMAAYRHSGWTAVAMLGTLLAALAATLQLVYRRRRLNPAAT